MNNSSTHFNRSRFGTLSLVITVLFVFSCSEMRKEAEDTNVSRKDSDLMSEVFDEYIRNAGKGQSKIDSFVGLPPSLFFKCASESVDGCQKIRDETRHADKSDAELLNEGDARSVTARITFPAAVSSEKYKGFKVVSSSTYRDEGRLLISFNEGAGTNERDVFFFKEKGTWKIIEIEQTGVHTSYAVRPEQSRP